MSRYDDCMSKFNSMSDDLKKRINDGIEENRKGKLTLIIKDKNGKTLPGAKIKAVQKNHEFLYGANLFMLDELETDEKNQIYKDSFPKIFNQATLPFYWKDLEPEEGKPRYAKDSPKIYRRPAPDLCLEYCEENGITPKMHCLNYIAWQPDWAGANGVEDNKKKLEKRYAELSERYKDRIHSWEVVNELLCGGDMKNFTKEIFKDDDIVEWSFDLAEKYFPDNELVINEAPQIWLRTNTCSNRSPYYMLIERSLKNGARIDAVGMQFHVFSKDWEKFMYDPNLLFEVMDNYARFGLPLQITEVTIPAYSNEAEDEKLQADLIEQLYSIWFSHKSVEMVTYWNMVDGYAAFAPQGDMTVGENRFYGGLLRFDLSRKPAFERICHLFNKKWHTEASLTANEKGKAEISAFYGKYDIEIDGKHYSVDHSSKSSGVIEIII